MLFMRFCWILIRIHFYSPMKLCHVFSSALNSRSFNLFFFQSREVFNHRTFLPSPFIIMFDCCQKREKDRDRKQATAEWLYEKAKNKNVRKTFSDVNWENEKTSIERVKASYCHLIFFLSLTHLFIYKTHKTQIWAERQMKFER